MPYYKFLNSEHVASVLEGSLVFSKLSYFRLLELKERRCWIGDRNEGRSINIIDNIQIDGSNPLHDKIRLEVKAAGINFTGPGKLNLRNNQFFVDTECYIFSCSWGSLGRLRRAICSPDQEDSYDACIQIRKVKDLAAAIWRAGSFRSLSESDSSAIQKISEWFYPPQWNFVTYAPNTFDLAVTGYRSASPFLKNVSFRNQSEVRIILQPREMDGANRLLVNFENSNTILSLTFKENRKKLFKPDMHLNKEEIYDRISRLYVCYVAVSSQEELDKIVAELIDIC